MRVRLTTTGTDVRVAVEGEGAGIPPAALPYVFERFYRAKEARQGEQAGLGLGLAICKGLVEAHGGHIGAESASSRGSAFWFMLPRA